MEEQNMESAMKPKVDVVSTGKTDVKSAVDSGAESDDSSDVSLETDSEDGLNKKPAKKDKLWIWIVLAVIVTLGLIYWIFF